MANLMSGNLDAGPRYLLLRSMCKRRKAGTYPRNDRRIDDSADDTSPCCKPFHHLSPGINQH